MKVTDISIVGLRYDRSERFHEGHVSMELRPPVAEGAPMRVQFLCHCRRGENSPATLVTYDLVKDALRQAHRMPGFRRGETRLDVDIAAASIGTTASA